VADTPGVPEVPDAVAEPARRHSLPLVWLLPVIAIVVGGWLAVRAILEHGPTITITFRTAEGLEAGKTKIRFKEVEIGTVTAITLSSDRSGVVVTAEIAKSAENLIVEDTRFWVVRPRISGGGISGISTLLSGAYIGMDDGNSTAARRSFVGLEVPPILTAGLPGREYALRANDLGSITFGTPVYFRRLEVGEVIAYELDENGSGFNVRVFVHAPYDRFVRQNTRFWQASGIDVAVSASGVQVNTESLSAMLLGGIAFGTPPDAAPPQPAEAQTQFTLFDTRAAAFKREDTVEQRYLAVFRESVRGLESGAPVDFRGIVIGEVSAIEVDFSTDRKEVVMAVALRIFPGRLRRLSRDGKHTQTTEAESRAQIDRMVAAGLRAQLRTGNLITGQLYVALDFFPKASKTTVDWSKSPPELPTIAGGLQELQTTLTSIATKLDKIPYDKISGDLRQSLQSLDRMLAGVDTLVKRLDAEVTPEVKATLAEARRTITSAERTLAADSPMQQEMREALREISRAAASLRALTDLLERQPGALIRGKTEEALP
jgi:paraquat-inducible protein B